MFENAGCGSLDVHQSSGRIALVFSLAGLGMFEAPLQYDITPRNKNQLSGQIVSCLHCLVSEHAICRAGEVLIHALCQPKHTIQTKVQYYQLHFQLSNSVSSWIFSVHELALELRINDRDRARIQSRPRKIDLSLPRVLARCTDKLPFPRGVWIVNWDTTADKQFLWREKKDRVMETCLACIQCWLYRSTGSSARQASHHMLHHC